MARQVNAWQTASNQLIPPTGTSNRTHASVNPTPLPVAGTVIERLQDPGEVVAAGAPVLELAELDRPYVDVFVPQARIAEVQLGRDAAVRVDSLAEPLPAFDNDLATVIFRVAQEALANVARHSGATEAHMTLEAAGDYYVATVEDNGKGGQGFFAIANRVGGFEEHPGLRDHFGLTIMRERAQRIGATVDVDSVPGAGTCVVLRLPERLPERPPEGQADGRTDHLGAAA